MQVVGLLKRLRIEGKGKFGIIMSRKSTREEFIKKSQKVHGDKYNYAKAVYNGREKKVCIVCPIHGEFFQLAGNHMSGSTCRQCSYLERSNRRKLGLSEMIRRATLVHGNKYNYSFFKYTNIMTKGVIVCSDHGEFLQSFNDHIHSQAGCPKCSLLNRRKFQKYVSENKKLMTEWNFKRNEIAPDKISCGSQKKVWWMCSSGHEWQAMIRNRKNGNGCPKCSSSSHASKAGSRWLDDLQIKERELPIIINGTKIIVDGIDYDANTVYEYFGNFWHGNPDVYNPDDVNPRTGATYGELYQKTLDKIELIKSAGYNLIYKWGD